jgi:ribosomal protein S18 acetylase RimI-like enzyme
MSADYSIERFSDAARLEELHSFVHSAFRDLPIDPPSSVLRETLKDFAARLRADTIFVASASGQLIGSVFCTPDEDALYIGRLAVRPDWRRRGVASALVDAAKAEAKHRGSMRMTLGARIALAGNVALFRRHGFVVVRETCHPGFTTPTSYDMEQTLAPSG